MPWSFDNLPDSVKNKSTEQKNKFIEVANAALSKGRTEQEAIFAGLAAIKTASVKKVNYSPKQVDKPLHLKALLETVKEEKVPQESQKELLQKPISKEFLGKSALPTGVTRNVVSADFNEKQQLVILFDTGEKITTSSVDSGTVENYTTITGSGSGTSLLRQLKDVDFTDLTDGYVLTYSDFNDAFYFTAPAAGSGGQPNNLKHFDADLMGTIEVFSFGQHKLNEVVAIYFIKNGKSVELVWEYTIDKNLIISSNVDMAGIKLVVHGK